ncbi:response regulator [Litorihabitans aurantiacus]|uniref:DNA-binding response regulator n=1 Tax=Litorihabitans aurantiacus TaxID=1930061 RepID=A0AA37XFS2_9MICO|nr:response regulator transcription factor [Litorihabitans aurantiacus]GMA32623.1 DNA-binding response regulator [Litorihabitans aurantiacus]
MTTAAPDGARSPRVLLVDDDPMIRTLLGRILQAQGIAVVGQASDGDEVLGAVAAHHPDVVVMDLRMERRSGIDATRDLKALPSPPGVLAMTSFDTEPSILDAVGAGADGFLAKDSGPEELVTAVRQVAAGEGALSPRAARVVMEQVRTAARTSVRDDARRRLAALTERERDVAQALLDGSSNVEIGRAMFVSEGTVKTHVAAALTKTGAANRVELAVLVATAG